MDDVIARPAGPAARTRHGYDRIPDGGMAVMLAVAAIAVRLPFRAEFLVNWDAVNFALGVGGFDLATHQPHPPGYLGWVAMSRAMTWVTDDPNAAMTMLSAISGALATGLVFLLARRFVDRRHAVVAALLFATAPLVWYYSVIALSYMTTGTVALGMLLALLVALQERSPRHLVLAGVLLAVVGALRPTDQVLLAPAWMLVAWSFGWRTRIRAACATAAASLVWVVPLLWLSGGLSAFADEGSAVADLAGGRTWVFGGNLAGIGQNIGMVSAGLVLGLFGGLVVLVLARSRGVRALSGLTVDERRLLFVWVVPALAVYLLLHTGQLGYVILLLPPAYVAVALALPHVSIPRVHVRRQLRRVAAHPALVVLVLLVANTLAFLALPAAGLRVLQASAAASTSDGDAPRRPPSLDRTRQYDIRANDVHWRALTDLVAGADPATTAILAETTSAGSFRHLSYYAQEHDLYGLGWDRTGDLGFLFHARDRRTTYSVDRLAHARSTVLFPTEVRTVLVPDAMLVERLHDSSVATVHEVRLRDGTIVAIVRLAQPAALVVTNPETDRPGSLTAGFPTASDRDEDDEVARIRFVAAAEVTDPHPSPAPPGPTPGP